MAGDVQCSCEMGVPLTAILKNFLTCLLLSNGVIPHVFCVQEMVTVETFAEFIRKKDVGRIRFAIRETLYDLDAADEVRTQRVYD